MIKYIFGFTWLLILTGIYSCKDSFDLLDDFSGKRPVVITDSVFVYAQDTLAIIGHIKSNGESDIEIAGFYYDTYSNPSVLRNQILFGKVKKSFSALITNLTEDSTYYFNTFAANDYESVKGNEVVFTVPKSKPPVAPCSLADGTIIENGTTYTIMRISSGENYALYTSVYGMLAQIYSGGYCDYYIGFTAKPTTGIYTVSSYGHDKKEKRSVMMQIRYSSENYSVLDGGKIYIEELGKGTGKYKVSFCEIQYKPFSNTYKCKGSFTTK
ncbi:MAG: hypothetical protein V4620_08445 [Bacteroidota bacterium]